MNASKELKRTYQRGKTPAEKIIFWGWKVLENGCWISNHSQPSSPIPQVVGKDASGKSVSLSARHVAYEHFIGAVPGDHRVKSNCDEQLCINPKHSFLQDKNRTCSIGGCSDPVSSREMCAKHYGRWKTKGTTDDPKWVYPETNDEERLRLKGWSEVPGPLDTPCWEWGGARDKSGYGSLQGQNRKQWKAHRLAYTVWKRAIPKGHLVRHKCDNPPCINPDHLVSGTNKDNNRDMFERGRDRAVGERNAAAKITEDDVRYIRASTETRKALAEKFDLHIDTIKGIRKRRYWKHVV